MSIVALVIGLLIVVIGLTSKRPFYNDVEMPLTKEQREDIKPPTKIERFGYVGSGLLLISYGIWRLLN